MTDPIAVVERAAAAYRTLADLAETVEDEWQYVTDLVDAYLPAIRALAGTDAARPPLTADQAAAVDEAIAEIALIVDPHRAIDWLSTYPHVVALALDGDVDSAPSGSDRGAATDSTDEEPDDDSPFRFLLRGRDR